jgi:hypothetical protein
MTPIELQILQLTGITAEHYSETVWQYGIAYLEHYTDGDTEAVNATIQRAEFWAWYKNQWQLIDRKFAACYKYYSGADASITEWLRKEWLKEHQPGSLRAYPHQFILNPKRKEVQHA